MKFTVHCFSFKLNIVVKGKLLETHLLKPFLFLSLIFIEDKPIFHFREKRSLIAKILFFLFSPTLSSYLLLQLTQAIWLQSDAMITKPLWSSFAEKWWWFGDYDDWSSDLIALLTQLVHLLGKYLNDSNSWLEVLWW